MRASAGTQRELVAMLDRFRTLVADKDFAILSEFGQDADVRIIGSEANESAEGPRQLEDFFKRIFARPSRYSWQWAKPSFSCSGDVAWLLADGEVIIRDDGGERRRPYRITGVLEKRDGKWLWLQFHGSEPA